LKSLHYIGFSRILSFTNHYVLPLADSEKIRQKPFSRSNCGSWVKPDIVTLDILMEEMDGLSALAAIKKQDPEAKVIMVSALGQEEKQEQARKLGALGYIRKPFKQSEIISEIERVFQ
ncbi:MAG: response regulator, partial [Dehalococcoidia bacterium]|nr:response regulator [Dehalococcoidia bacterium]